MKLTTMSAEVFNYVRENGGRVSIPEIAEVVGRSTRSVGANVTDLSKKKLVVREKVKGEDEDITYVVLTEAGKVFDPDAEDED